MIAAKSGNYENFGHTSKLVKRYFLCAPLPEINISSLKEFQLFKEVFQIDQNSFENDILLISCDHIRKKEHVIKNQRFCFFEVEKMYKILEKANKPNTSRLFSRNIYCFVMRFDVLNWHDEK